MAFLTETTKRSRNPMAFIVLCLSFIPSLSAQQPPLIRANTISVTIKDGPVILSDTWNLSPEIRPDIYHAIKSATEKKITFYTDIDSISFHCSPGNSYDFAVVLRGKDTCYTKIVMDMDTAMTRSGIGKLISRELLAMDFMVFRDYLEREHAGLYRYRTKKEMDNLFDQGLQSIRGPAERLDFGKKIMHLVSEIRDGHTGTNLSSTILNAYRDSTRLFPLLLYFEHKRAFVRCGKLKKLPAGTEIMSIDGRTIGDIREKLFSLLPGDGKITSKKRHTLNNGSFAFLYRLVFGDRKSFIVGYKGTDGKKATAGIEASFSTDFDCEPGGMGNKGKDLQVSYQPNDIAILTIRTFDQGRLARSGLDFPKFLENSFRELKERKTQKLIIDIRGNGGGFNEYGPLLYSYLAKGNFGYFAAVYGANDPMPLKNNPLTRIQQPKPDSFKGEIVFLIDGLSFSTTADFCAIARSNRRGKFVGEETAGAYYGNNSGKTIRLELPNTGIQIVIPRFRYVNDVKKTRYADRGVMPDHVMIPAIDNVISHRDVQLDFAIRLAQSNE